MNKPNQQGQFIWSDAWILLSVIYATERSPEPSFSDIIAMADYINHAIPTRDELEIGFAHLVDADYLANTAQCFALTDGVRSFWKTIGSHKRTASEALAATAAFIGTPRWAPSPLPVASTEHYVSKANYDAAIEKYLKSMRR